MNSSDASSDRATAVSGDGRSARWDAHRQSRRTELVKAARSVIHRLGPGASMEDCASAAGTSKSVFYRYFGDKDGLRRAMGVIVIGQMRTKVVDAARTASSEEAGLRAMVRAYLHMAQTSPNIYFFVTDVARDPLSPAAGTTADEPLDDFFADLTTMMTERMHAYLRNRDGDRTDQAALELWPRAAIGMVRSAGETWLRAPDTPAKPSEDALTQTITAWLVSGIAGGPTPSTPGPTGQPGMNEHELERHTP